MLVSHGWNISSVMLYTFSGKGVALQHNRYFGLRTLAESDWLFLAFSVAEASGGSKHHFAMAHPVLHWEHALAFQSVGEVILSHFTRRLVKSFAAKPVVK